MNYKQSKLRKGLPEGGWLETVSFLPGPYANPGARIRIKDHDGTWSDGWEVAEVWEERSEDQLPDWHRDIRQHRKRTGDRLPRFDCDA